jgi:hypothetical protein
MPSVGCSDATTDNTDEPAFCQQPDTFCDDGNDCTENFCTDGMCDHAPLEDGTVCAGGAGTCDAGTCTFPWTEDGIRAAVNQGGGPHTFDCEGSASIAIDGILSIGKDVVLDGEGNLTMSDAYIFLNSGVVGRLERLTLRNTGVLNRGTLHMTGVGISDASCCLWCDLCIENLGTMTLTGCTVSATEGAVGNSGTLTIANSTISHSGLGNAIVSLGSRATVVLVNSSIVSTGEPESSAMWVGGGSTAEAVGTIVGGGCAGEVTSNGYNIESPGDTCGFDQATDQTEKSPAELNLGELADNGGPTKTHAPLTEPTVSVAIDQIPQDKCLDAEGAPLMTDQRGLLRPVAILGPEPKCDVGSVEVQP